MSVALIELVEMTATLNVVVSINSTTVMQTYWTTPLNYENTGRKKEAKKHPLRLVRVETPASGFDSHFLTGSIFIMQIQFLKINFMHYQLNLKFRLILKL